MKKIFTTVIVFLISSLSFAGEVPPKKVDDLKCSTETSACADKALDVALALTFAMCGDKGSNLDRTTAMNNSQAVLYIAAFESVRGNLDRDSLNKIIPRLYCNKETGFLEIRSEQKEKEK